MTDKLTPKQLKLVAALATDDDVQAACAAAGVGRTTAYRWLKDPEVQSALAQHREQSFSRGLKVQGLWEKFGSVAGQ